jgi:hypothetical protein
LKSYEIHTHGDYRTLVPRKDGSSYYRNLNSNERKSVDDFSPEDRYRSDRSNYPQFMLTPGGIIREFVPNPIGRMGFGLLGKDGKTHILGNPNKGPLEKPSGL